MEQQIQAYLLALPDEKRALTLQVRDIFMSVDPAIKEVIKWNYLTFYVNKFNFAFIYTYTHVDYINVAFFFATSLSDPKNLFKGTGKTMRHIKVTTPKDIPAVQIRKWIKESLLIGKEKIKKTSVKKVKAVE